MPSVIRINHYHRTSKKACTQAGKVYASFLYMEFYQNMVAQTYTLGIKCKLIRSKFVFSVKEGS